MVLTLRSFSIGNFAYQKFLYILYRLSIFEAYQCLDDDADDGQSKNRFFNVIGLVFEEFYVYLLYYIRPVWAKGSNLSLSWDVVCVCLRVYMF